jgi:O-antigen/teichoic acid export membrane protein
MSTWRSSQGRRSFTHDALVLVGNRFTVMAIGMVTGVILARCLGASGRGLVAAATVYPAVILSLLEMGVRQSSAYHLGKRIYSNAQVIGAVSALVLSLGVAGMMVCAGLLWWMGNPDITHLIILLAVAPIPLSILTSYGSGIFLGNRLVGQFANIGWMVEVFRLLAIVLFVWLLAWGPAGALLAALLSGLAVGIYAAWRLSSLAPIGPKFEGPVIGNLIRKGLVYSVALFVITLNYKVNIIVMERLSSAAEIGVFALGVSVAQMTWALPQAITTALFSHSATAADEDVFSGKVQRLFRVSILIALALVVALGIAAPILVPLIYGADFRPSVRVIHLLLPGVFFLLGLKILNMDLAGRGKPNVSLWAMIPALALNGALSVSLVPRHGAQGAAIASSASYAFGGLGMMLVYCRHVGIGWGELLRYRRSDFAFLSRRWGRRRDGEKGAL